MMRTTKLVLLLLGMVVVTLGVAIPPKAEAATVTPGVQEAQQVPEIIAERRFANHIKGLQWLGMANKGEWGNPDVLPLFLPELEYPGGSGTVFLFSAGLWVGALKNGIPTVSTCTDGDNGTGEYGPLEFATSADQNSDVGSIGWLEKTKDPVTDDMVLDSFREGHYLGKGVKEKDDDADWTVADDLNGDGKASADWDGPDADANGDGVFDYDPEAHVDEDPAGDMSNDFMDNDNDGLFDMADPDHDGDMVLDSLDDDGDGLLDEDDIARAGQEFITSFADTCQSCLDNPDTQNGYTPMGVRVVQHSYQWSESYADDFILIDFLVTNIGDDLLEDVCLGTFFDFDIGHVTQTGDERSTDDITYYLDDLQMAIGGDNDGDDGLLEAQFFGVRVVQTPLPTVQATYRNFERQAGGDPADNAAKYALMVSGERDPDQFDTIGDWRFVLAFGPLGDLAPGQTLPVTVAIVSGFDTNQIRVNGAQAKAMFDADFRGPAAPDAPGFLATAIDRGARIVWRNSSEASIDPISQYADFQGYNVWRSPNGLDWTLAQSWDLPDSLGLNIGWPPPVSTVQGYDYEYTDTGLGNGFPVRYVVTAFDDGGNGDGINTPAYDERNSGVGVLESSRGADFQQLIYPAGTPKAAGVVDEVYVVPNPYIGSSRLEQVPRTDEAGVRQYYKDIEFRGLPGECTIEVYTMGGDLVQTIHHDDGLSWHAWNLRTRLNMEILAGIYLYRVSDANGNEHIGKFVVVK